MPYVVYSHSNQRIEPLSYNNRHYAKITKMNDIYRKKTPTCKNNADTLSKYTFATVSAQWL